MSAPVVGLTVMRTRYVIHSGPFTYLAYKGVCGLGILLLVGIAQCVNPDDSSSARHVPAGLTPIPAPAATAPVMNACELRALADLVTRYPAYDRAKLEAIARAFCRGKP